LLQTLTEEKPESLYDLAQKLEKDQAYVLREAKVLEGLRLLELRSSSKTEGRKKLKPIALYDKVVIDCGLKRSLKTA
jgi:predicted transcriptional regulator